MSYSDQNQHFCQISYSYSNFLANLTKSSDNQDKNIWQTLPTSVFVLVLTGSSWIGQKNLNNCDQIDKNADLGHFSLFLACFGPVTAPVSVLNIPTEYIFYGSNYSE